MTPETGGMCFPTVPKIWERQWVIQGRMWEDTFLSMWA